MPKMLILRGNSGEFPDESGNKFNYKDGALHEQAAKDFATCLGLEGEVLPVSGDPRNVKVDGKWVSDRTGNLQTMKALDKFRHDDAIVGFYGFSGGGYDVLHILNQLNTEELKRIHNVVVLGAPPVKGYPQQSDFESATFAKKKGDKAIKWDLVYPPEQNPPSSFTTPNNAMKHMFGPEWLLSITQCSKP
jgi:hypothetical protein